MARVACGPSHLPCWGAMARIAVPNQIAGRAARRRSTLERFPSSWLFLAPAVVFFVGWQLYPVVRVAWLSFTDYHYLRVGEPVSWVGLRNYREAFQDPLLRTGLVRAAKFTLLFLPGMIFIPMLLAVLVDRVTHSKLATFYRLVLLVPSMIPGPLIFVLWRWMYDLYIGPINYLLVNVL